jgi:hypothetical protein
MRYVLAGDTFETTYYPHTHYPYPIRAPYTLVSEHVSFVPAKNISGDSPYVKGILDSCWVKYRKGERPTTKEGWENIIHMELLPLNKKTEA